MASMKPFAWLSRLLSKFRSLGRRNKQPKPSAEPEEQPTPSSVPNPSGQSPSELHSRLTHRPVGPHQNQSNHYQEATRAERHPPSPPQYETQRRPKSPLFVNPNPPAQTHPADVETPPAEPDLDHLSEPKPIPERREPLRRTGKGYRRKHTAKIYTLVRVGLLNPGEELYSTNSRYRATAKITVDGNISTKGSDTNTRHLLADVYTEIMVLKPKQEMAGSSGR